MQMPHARSQEFSFEKGSEVIRGSIIWSGGPGMTQGLRYFRRAQDNSFVEPAENPVADFSFYNGESGQERGFVVDWNSDGLPDLLVVEFRNMPPQAMRCSYQGDYDYYQHVLKGDLMHNSLMDIYEDVDVGGHSRDDLDFARLTIVDWNRDGFLDLLMSYNRHQSQPRLFENRRERMNEVISAFENVTATSLEPHTGPNNFPNGYRLAVADFDGDGEVDVLIASEADGKLHYHRQVSGRLQAEEQQNPFRNITVPLWWDTFSQQNYYHLVEPIFLDWDNDGDMDLLLGAPDGRIFEQTADGRLEEWPLEQSPVRSFLDELRELKWGLADQTNRFRMMESTWKFVDCDVDGDLDLLRFGYAKDGTWHSRLQACEHDGTHALRCDDDFLCLGANLSNFRTEGFGEVMSFDLGNVTDGRLQLITSHRYSKGAVLWSGGFCAPQNPCNEKGLCTTRQIDCSCVSGHEMADCSGCKPDFYSAQRQLGQLHSCIACPGAGGKVCHGRGLCFDDATARHAPQESTAALTAQGNGTCRCHEVHFSGHDSKGRENCVEGSCPAGTEERNGRCDPCNAGATSVSGGFCKNCLPGRFSLSGSASCLRCPSGSTAQASGASACLTCPAGRYELQQQFCNECPPGFISSMGQSSCAKCPAGFMADKPGSSACVPCAGGFFSEEGSAKCSECPPGFISSMGNSSCAKCPAGFMADKPGSIACVPCPGGFFSEEASAQCIACPSGSISDAASEACRPCDAGFFSGDALTCEPCPGGKVSKSGSNSCQSCPAGEVSSPRSAACTRCEGDLLRAVPDSMQQQCQVLGMDVVFALVGLIAATFFCFLCLTGLYSSIPVEDVSAQGQKWVVTNSLAHLLLKWSLPEVRCGPRCP